MSDLPVFQGGIVDGSAIDSLSVEDPEDPDLKWPGLPIQGPKNYPLECTTICTGATEEAPEGFPILIVDPASPPTPAPGIWSKPSVPPPLVRVGVEGVVNSEARGVYFEGTLVPVSGDAIRAVTGEPNPRPLTGGTLYPTIIIGSKT